MCRMAIGDAFLPPDFSRSTATAVATSVQCSLYQRLRKSHGNRAGALAWLLVRLAQPDHREHEEAFDSLLSQPMPALAALSTIVGSARAAAGPGKPGVRELFDAIAVALETARAAAHLRAVK